MKEERVGNNVGKKEREGRGEKKEIALTSVWTDGFFFSSTFLFHGGKHSCIEMCILIVMSASG